MSSSIRVSGIAAESIVDGPGLRLAIFTQGCPIRCDGCHNPAALDFEGGTVMSVNEILQMIEANPLLGGVTFSGGDPFSQPEPLVEIAKAVRKRGLSIWIWSGWTYEQLLEKPEQSVRELLELCDVLVDGPFILAQRTLNLMWRGSRNQRVIDLQKSRDCGRIVEYTPQSFSDFERPRMF